MDDIMLAGACDIAITSDDDFEKRLRYISKEEATILSRMKKRSTRWKKTARNLIVFFVLPKIFVIGYAMMIMRTVMLEWKLRSLRVLRIFKYDPDPAAKAVAASVLASKLGADSGLHWFVDESHLNQHDIGKIGNVEFMQSNGLRRRNASEARSPGSMGACRDAFRHLFGTRAAIYYQSEALGDHIEFIYVAYMVYYIMS
ncbi:putative Lunapark family protein [Helianthus annuus]|nr:putative Lunapark family protein [Helianthus annuus]